MSTDTDPWRDNWAELQRNMTAKAAIAIFLTAWVAWYQQRQAEAFPELLMGLAFLAACTCLAIGLPRILPSRLAALAVTATSLAAALLAYSPLGYSEAFPFLAIPLIIAAFVSSPWLPPALLLVLGFQVAVWPGLPPPAWCYWLLLGSLCVLVSLLARDLRAALSQAWAESERTADLARQVQANQEGINKLNKALTLSNQLLRRTLEELASAQKEAEEARQFKEQFATTVSHELRTPLNVVLGFIEIMQRYPEVYKGVRWTSALRRDIAEIQRNAHHLSELADDILDLARIQALRMPIRREDTDLAALLKEAVDIAGRLLLDKPEVRLRLELAPDLPIVYVDPLRVRQVALNLLANACRFTAQGEVCLSAALAGGEVVVCVSDTGPGINPEQLETIFEEFRQGDDTARNGLQRLGKGLGLAIAKRFVQMHGGRIWATSTPGLGSRFCFTLPMQPIEVVKLPPPPLPLQLRQSTAPAVVVVDRGQARTRLARHLEGYQVLPADDLLQARQLVRDLHPHAVIMNVPPQPQGSGVTPAVLSDPVPVFTCTLPGSSWTLEPELFDDWLVKPIAADQLYAALDRLPSARKILIADDDRSFVRLVRRLLEACGGKYEVLAAYDGQEALDKARQYGMDVILLDLCLPNLDGRTVAALLRADKARRPSVLAVTALQPGEEGNPGAPSCFSITLAPGLSEEATTGLLKYCLANLSPAYARQPLSPTYQEAPGERLA